MNCDVKYELSCDPHIRCVSFSFRPNASWKILMALITAFTVDSVSNIYPINVSYLYLRR
jgi:hypothetical protein